MFKQYETTKFKGDKCMIQWLLVYARTHNLDFTSFIWLCYTRLWYSSVFPVFPAWL